MGGVKSNGRGFYEAQRRCALWQALSGRGCVCDSLDGAGCGLMAPVSWSVQFLEFSFCLSGLSLKDSKYS